MCFRIIRSAQDVAQQKSASVKPYILSEAAWKFAYCLLWSHQKLSITEVESAKRKLVHYFKNNANKRVAFISFCERIILSQRYYHAHPELSIEHPSLWLNPYYYNGFSKTFAWLCSVRKTRKENPFYLQHFSTLASFYYGYANNPVLPLFNKCRCKLRRQKAYSLLAFWYAIEHYDEATIIHA